MTGRKRTGLIVLCAVGAIVIPLPFITGLVWLPFQFAHTALLERLPTPILARVLIGRAGETVVADSRGGFDLEEGVAFFSQPRAAGSGLCAVDVYAVSAGVTSAGRKSHRDPLLRQETRYAIVSADQPDCAAFRDFTRLINIKGAEYGAPRAVEAYWQALRLANEPGAVPIRCLSRRESRDEKPCDGQAYLAALDLKKLNEIEVFADPDDRARLRYRARVYDGDIHGHPLLSLVRLDVSADPAGPKGKVTAISIEQDAG